MKTVRLIRDERTADVTRGYMTMDGKRLCDTLEEPWRDNKPQVSCIPTGLYYVEKFSGAKYKNVWHVKSVPNRSAILIHNGNTVLHTEGCILVGAGRGNVGGLKAVLNSVATLVGLRKILPNEFMLEVVNA